MKALFNDIKFEANLGHILRHGFCFDIEEILLTENQRPLNGSKLCKTSANYKDKVPVSNVKLIEYLNSYDGRIICPIPNNKAKELNNFKFKKNDLLIFGNECNVPKIIQEYASEFLYIPMDEKLVNQCLNLSTAFSIIAYEYFKQIRKGGIK